MQIYKHLYLFLSIFISISFAPPIFSLENHNKGNEPADIITLPSNVVIDNDYFMYGKNIEVSGTINGDLYILGGQVLIDGKVNGDIIAIAGSIEMAGDVSNNARFLAGQASISGHIGNNLTGVSANIELFPSATIGNNVVIISGNSTLGSTIYNHVHLYASNARISNQIGGDVTAYVGKMRISSKAKIGGYVEYWSNNMALIDSTAHIDKEITHHPSFFYTFFHGKLATILKISSKLATSLMNFFYTLIIGLVMIRYFRRPVDQAILTLQEKPLRAFITGLTSVSILSIASLALIITILGLPFALTLLSLTIITFYTAKIISVLWISKYLFYRCDFQEHIFLYFTSGLILYFLITLIPYVGIVISLLALLLGLGGSILGRMEKQRKGGEHPPRATKGV